MSDFFVYILVFLMGGTAYGAMELLFRGYTHWTMVIVAGICVSIMHFINTKSRFPLWQKCILGAAVITTVEFVSGCMINIVFKLGVWDYSGEIMNLFGQICLVFSLLWLLASTGFVFISRIVEKYLSRK